MKYRDILGFSKKNKKTIKESKKSKKNKLIESINEEMWNYPMQQFQRLHEQDKPMTKIPDSPFEKDKEDDVKPGTMNETIPAYAKEWKNMEKACYALEKSVKALGKAVEKQDKKKGKLIPSVYKTLDATIQKFKKLLSDEILSKLQ
tara:strand:+ start:101 stop:538 length:438 start_codon:yes stop_codon:yes gene_type:complete